MLLPTNIYNYIAVSLRGVSCYDEIVQLVEAQTKDPVTGLVRGEKPPVLNVVQPGTMTNAVGAQRHVDYLAGHGIDPATEHGETILAALKGKGKGKGGKGKFKCYACGK